jgi:hypothetical protein
VSPVRGRVAEVIVTVGGQRRRGSGYRVTTGAVLTAAHVVAGADSVSVRFEPDLPGEWTVAATDWRLDVESDLAVLIIVPRDSEELEPARFGRVGDRAAVLTVQAVGFPLWKMRDEDGTTYRDSAHVSGSLAVLSNWREGTLEVVVAAPGDVGADRSPWEGMSGAALWVGERIVGVVARHHPGDGPGRLAAARLNRALPLNLPADLPDVVAASAAGQVLTAYQELLSDIAPKRLYDRGDEIADLVRFCAGETPYRWFQAGPWAGKSALLAWFARYPPRGVDVVSFFITSRYAGQSDSDAYTEAMLEQLAALAGETAHDVVRSRARPGHLIRLLRQAARHSAQAGRRLLLVVDGLDEDTGGDRPSIASLLPADPPEGVRVLVASRPHPELPDDVPGDHPLRTVAPVELSRSSHAAYVGQLAKTELSRALRGSEIQRHVLGLITASGGGLTRADIVHLTKQPPYELDALFNGRLGRTVVSGHSSSSVQAQVLDRAEGLDRPLLDHSPAKVYLFGHETLRVMAEEQYGAGVEAYRDLIHAWADEHCERGWPADTSPYLLRGYTRMLADSGNLARLLALAVDRVRRARLLDVTGGDGLALAEIATATDLAAARSDFGALLLLAVARDDVAERNANIPVELPALWLTLGRPTRAMSLANGIANPDAQASALVLTAEAAYALGAPGTKRLVAKIERQASRLADRALRDRTLGALAVAAATAGRRKHPARLLAEVRDPRQRLLGEARCAMRAGDHARAEALVGELDNALPRIELLSELIAAVGGEEAVRLADIAERAVLELSNVLSEESLPSALPVAVARTGDPDRAERLLQKIWDLQTWTAAVVGLVRLAVDAGDRARVDRLVEIAEQVAGDGDTGRRAIDLLRHAEQIELGPAGGAWTPVETTVAVAEVYAAAGDLGRAMETVTGLPDQEVRDATLARLAPAVAVASGELLIEQIRDPAHRAQAGALVARAVAGRDPSLARELATAAEVEARQITDAARLSTLLVRLCEVMAERGDRARLDRLATAAERSTARIESPVARASVLTQLVETSWRAGDQARAERLADQTLELADGMAEIVGDLASTVATGDVAAAERVARRIQDLPARARALARIASTAGADRARELMRAAQQEAEHIEEPESRAETQAFIATEMARTGDFDRAAELAASIGNDRRWRPIATARVARELAKMPDRDRARDLIDLTRRQIVELDNPWFEKDADPVLAEAFAALGDYEEVRRFADDHRNSDPWNSDLWDQAWSTIGTGMARAGDVRRGELLVREIRDPVDRARALAAVAAATTNIDVTTRLAVELLTSEAWQEAAGLAARLTGSGITDVIDTVLARDDTVER